MVLSLQTRSKQRVSGQEVQPTDGNKADPRDYQSLKMDKLPDVFFSVSRTVRLRILSVNNPDLRHWSSTPKVCCTENEYSEC